MTTTTPKPEPARTTTTPEITPASDEEIAGIEPNIAKTEWQTCSNCDAGLRSINTPPYLIGTHEEYCILTMWPRVIARIEQDRARIRELEELMEAYFINHEEVGSGCLVDNDTARKVYRRWADECGRIIQAHADRARASKPEPGR